MEKIIKANIISLKASNKLLEKKWIAKLDAVKVAVKTTENRDEKVRSAIKNFNQQFKKKQVIKSINN